MDSDLSPEMLFSVAAVIWLDMRVKIGPRTGSTTNAISSLSMISSG
jgi:hypothetical protein